MDAVKSAGEGMMKEAIKQAASAAGLPDPYGLMEALKSKDLAKVAGYVAKSLNLPFDPEALISAVKKKDIPKVAG